MQRSLAATLSTLALAMGLLGCGNYVTGDFGGIAFVPTEVVFATYHRHDLIAQGGTRVAAELSASQRRVHLFFSAAEGVSSEGEWKAMPFSRIQELRRGLAVSDGLLLMNLEAQMLKEGASLELQVGDLVATGPTAHVVSRLPRDPLEQGLGADIQVRLEIDDVDLQTNGVVMGRVFVQRKKAEGQKGAVATGEVEIGFVANLAPERLAKSNLNLAAPVMLCASKNGPARAGACAGTPSWPEADATGTHRLP